MQTVDLNCDMGEAFGRYDIPFDENLMNHITSANIACGFHAGDPQVMRKTVQMALKQNVAVGAHPGLPDLQGFGRREMKINHDEAYAMTLYQIGALSAFVKAAGGELHHVKPHGALYNMAAREPSIARAIAQAIYDFDPRLKWYALAGSEMIQAAKDLGITAISEVFADRAYHDDGSLVARSDERAVIKDAGQTLKQVLQMVKYGSVTSVGNKKVAIKPETICVHGDGAHAVEFASTLHRVLQHEGIIMKAP